MSGALEMPPATNGGATSAQFSASDASFWRLLLTTPLGELVRGNLTGKIIVPQRAALPPLPHVLDAVVMDVTKRTRLWRSERREIARELVAHFSDGLEAGRSEADLLRDFGDPAQAAALLRRAAKRNRAWPWRAMRMTVRATFFSVLAIIGLYLLMTLRFYLGRPTIANDYRVQLNAAATALSDDQKAWPLYREALLQMPKNLPDEVVNGDYSRMPLPGEQGWDTVEAYLHQAAPVFALARQAASRRGMGLVIGYPWSVEDQKLWPSSVMSPEAVEFTSPQSDGMIGMLLPQLGSLRTLARALGWDVQRAVAAGDPATVTADLQALFALSRHVRETPTLISELVGMTVLSVATTRIDALLAEKPEVLSDQQWIEVAHSLAAFDDATLHVSLRGERLFFDDMLQRLYTDDGHGDGRMTPRGLQWMNDAMGLNGQGDEVIKATLKLGGPAMASVMLGRREMQEQYERLMGMLDADAAIPLWQREESRVDQILGDWQASPLQRMRHLPLCLMMPAIGRASVNSEMASMRRDVTLTAIALQMRHRQLGTWPKSLGELVPQYLPGMPTDRFDGEPLRYLLRNGRPVLYSVGNDRTDEGGTPGATSWQRQNAQRWCLPSEIEGMKAAAAGNPSAAKDVTSSDWILWPPPLEEPLRVGDPATAP